MFRMNIPGRKNHPDIYFLKYQHSRWHILPSVHLLLFKPTFSLMQICHQLPVNPLNNLGINHLQISLLH